MDGTPVLIHTLQAFYRYSSSITVILVLPEDDFGTWNALAKKHDFKNPSFYKREERHDFNP
ncbi:MAG: hypothetical protein WDN75_08285 [Bacteroidota bacterium]